MAADQSTCRISGCDTATRPVLRCQRCGADFLPQHSHGRVPSYCSPECKRPRALKKDPDAPRACTRCGVMKSATEFTARTDRESRQSWCKECVSDYQAEWYKRDPSRRAASARAWYSENRERAARNASKWKRENSERVNIARHRRRAGLRGARFGVESLRQRLAFFGGMCWMCGGQADTLDHVKPIFAGGSHLLANIRPACRPCNSAKGCKWSGVGTIHEFRK